MSTTADRITYHDINEVISFSHGPSVEIVGTLVAIEYLFSEKAEVLGLILHIGNKCFTVTNEEMEKARITFLTRR